jgi:hypothetical protein
MRKLTSVDELARDANIMAAVHSHVVAMPPLGPFAHVSAVELSAKLRAACDVDASPALCCALFLQLWDVDQWRTWVALYAPCAVSAAFVDAL